MPIRRSLVALAAVLALTLAACGDADDTTEVDTDGTITTSPVPEPTTDDTLPPGGSVAGDGGDQTRPADGEDPYAVGTLEIRITHPDAETVDYVLGCAADTATVSGDAPGIDAAEACARLTEEPVVSRLVDGAPEDQICTEQYGGPDEATITGELFGSEIDTVIDRTDGCGIADWDDLLAGVLPPALGVTE